MEKKILKKVDFRKIEIENVDGSTKVVDASKTLGDAVFMQAKGVEMSELGRAIWHNGEVELRENCIQELSMIISASFSYVVRTALLNAINA